LYTLIDAEIATDMALFDTASPLELFWVSGALITLYFCIRSLRHAIHDTIRIQGRELSPNEVANIVMYRVVRCVRELSNCVINVSIIALGVFLAFRPPAAGYSNHHPSPGAIMLAVCMTLIEIACMASAIMTERLRTTLYFLEQRGIVTIYGWDVAKKQQTDGNKRTK
jgi:hypothetical protein